MIVHFPIALILTGFLADFLSLFIKKEKCLSKSGFYLMILGAIAAIFAQLTGTFFTEHPESGSIYEIFELHETFAFITTIIIVIGSAFRIILVAKKKDETKLRWIVFAFYLAAAVSVGLTGYLGGTMVFDYMTSI